MKLGNRDLSSDNLVLYEGGAFDRRIATLVKQGTLEDCLPQEEPAKNIILLPGSPAARKYGLGFLKENEAYAPGKTVSLDSIDPVAGYETNLAWEDFIRRVKLERLEILRGKQPNNSLDIKLFT